MKNAVRSHLFSSVVGGLIVAGGLIAFGVTGRRSTQTIVQEAPAATERTAGNSSMLTPHAIFQRESPGVVFISARLVDAEPGRFDVLHEAQTGTLTGSGFLVDGRGDVMTVYHLIDGARPMSGISVRFQGGLERPATVVAADPAADVAILHVGMRGAPAVAPLPLGNSTLVRIGDPTLAIGNPHGLDRTLTSGIVSSFEHELAAAGGVSVDNVIQTDQPLDGASVGGPLLDAAGRVIGVDSEVTGADGTAVAFATPIDTATPVLRHVERRLGARP